MQILGLNRYTLSLCAAAALLWACGGSPAPITNPVENHAARGAVSNHVFTAAYSGQRTCLIGLYGSFSLFIGNGTASVRGFRKKSTESVGYNPCNSVNGLFTLTGRSSKDTITGQISGYSCSADTYTVTGGTGRYARASGSGTVTFTCRRKQTYKDSWSGTISY